MFVAYGPPELMHEAKDGIHLLSQLSGVHLTDASYAGLTQGPGQTPRFVNLPCRSIEVCNVASSENPSNRQTEIGRR
jgi:hypothetical protein